MHPMADDLAVYSPSHFANRSTLRKWYDKLTGLDRATGSVKVHAREAALTARQLGEGVITGAVLGAIHAELREGLDPHGVPIDGTIAVLGAVGAFAMANEEYAHDLRNIATSAASVFAFRKTDALLSAKKAARIAGESAMAGEDIGREDHVLRAARALDNL